ncbi:hypothetical protein LEP1GSC170_2398 [Leptospira interrogans serovar Bataviae str. HAI135]|nr:hypothetical protein LEP1GSC170_2398 [Leptospira interrogans serovar Bataviae str. HAI135]
MISITILPSLRTKFQIDIKIFDVPKILKTFIYKLDILSYYVHRMKEDIIDKTLSVIDYSGKDQKYSCPFIFYLS